MYVCECTCGLVRLYAKYVHSVFFCGEWFVSDAFLLHGSELHLYSKINIENVHINTRTVAIFRAQPTCIGQHSCGECSSLRESSAFNCMWCEAAGHCSDGADRLRENWNNAECHLTNTTTCTNPAHTEYRTSVLSSSSSLPAVQTSTVVSAVTTKLSSLAMEISDSVLVILLNLFP